ncbi:MAG: PAS domain S-box protein, partial [Melioribacteraceae bacterium]|nr:PAS domain S-box protein [Melioribacteraceae bacterium]
MSLLIAIMIFFYLPFNFFALTSICLFSFIVTFSYYSEHKENIKLNSIIRDHGETADQLISEVDVRYNITKLIQEIGNATSMIQEESKIVETIIVVMNENLEFSRGAIFLADSAKKNLIYKSGFGFDQKAKGLIDNIKIRLDSSDINDIFVNVFMNKEPRLVEHIDLLKYKSTFSNFKIIKQLNIKSMICVPIVFEDRSLGILVVDSLDADRPYIQSDINILMAMSSQTAISIMGVRAFQDLKESEKKHRTLVETIRDIVYTVDMEGRFTYLSPMAEVITGYKDNELIGRPFIDIIAAEDKETVMQRFVTGFKSSGRLTYEINILTKDQSTVPVEFNVAPLTNRKSQTVGWIGVARDISRRKQEEAKRQDMELKALTQDKLASIGEIATGIAHEINQPLSYIKVILESTLSDMENEKLDKSELSEDFNESLRQVGKITNIISHLRTFGRSDVTSFSPLKLSRIIDDTLILMKERLRINNIKMSIQVPENFPYLYGNHAKLEQVFVNLIQNSMDAMEKHGKGEILLQAQVDNQEAIIIYKDTGDGVDP